MKHFVYTEGNELHGRVLAKRRERWGKYRSTFLVVRLSRNCDFTVVKGMPVRARNGECVLARIVRKMRRRVKVRDEVRVTVGTPIPASKGRQVINIDLAIKRGRWRRAKKIAT